MESLLARALESKLKYWLRSFTREQFKLQGRTVRLYNLDINGEVLHASIGLPPTLLVTQARVGRLELKLPSLSNVQTEPIVVEIDKLDVVLMEKSGNEPETPSNGIQGVTVTAKSGSYGFADKIADGMTLQVGTVNLMLETRGGAACRERAAWTPPLASITIRNLLLYTTNERWRVVNLKDAREFSSNKKCIYVFKKLEWESLSVDLLPHPDMFTDERLTSSKLGSKRDDDGAKRLFFGGERFLDNISGEAYITMHRTEQNNALGMEVQVHLPDVLCPALSEPGLRALLRFMTGLYVCMNRGDVVPKAIQSAEAAGRTMVAVTVEHIFLCIKDAEFQLEVILQCLQYMRASTSIGESTKTMTRIAIGGLFLRDTLCHPSCTLVQPSMRNISNEPLPIPNFANEKLWPRIYPLEFDSLPRVEAIPLLCMYSLQTVPSPAPPSLASQTVIQCQPLKINLQEESCLRIASFLADGVVVEHGVVIPATSVDSIYFSLKEFDLTIPIDDRKEYTDSQDKLPEIGFTGTRLHVEDFVFAQAPSLNFKLLKLDKDPACFALWQGQPVDASQKKWVMRASRISAALETDSCDDSAQSQNPMEWSSGLWPCVEMLEPCIETAMVTADGRPLVTVPPPGGIVRFGIACKHYISNTSVEQLFFVLKMFEYMGRMSESLLKVSRAANKAEQEENPGQLSMKKSGSIGSIIEMAPSDTAVSLGVDLLELKFLESLLGQWEVQGTPLVQISGSRLSLKVTHRTLGGAVAISSKLFWQNILVECVETDNVAGHIATCFPASDMVRVDELHRSHSTYHGQLQVGSGVQSEQKSSMRAVLWIAKRESSVSSGVKNQNSSKDHLPFLDVNVVNVIPYGAEDAECHSLSITAKIAGVRLGGGMVYNESLLHRFGILGPDGEPGKEVKRVLKNLSSGPLANILKPPPPVSRALSDGIGADNIDSEPWDLGSPDDINIDLQLWDWVFALEGASIVSEDPLRDSSTMVSSTVEGGCWLSTFRCLHVSGQGAHNLPVSSDGIQATQTAKYPVQKINVGIEGVKVIKPHPLSSMHIQSVKSGSLDNDNATQQNFLDSHRNIGSEGSQHAVSVSNSYPQTHSGLDVEVRLIISEDEEDLDLGMGQWVVESLKAAVTEPVEVEATKAEVEYLIKLFKLEIESASRIAAGIMKLLQLQGSIGQAAIDQLSNLGSGSLDKLITPERTRRRSSIGSVTGAPFYNGTPHKSLDLDPTMSKLEEAVSKSQEICAKLNARLIEAQSDLDSYVSLPELTSLMQQLDTMKGLLEKSAYKVL